MVWHVPLWYRTRMRSNVSRQKWGSALVVLVGLQWAAACGTDEPVVGAPATDGTGGAGPSSAAATSAGGAGQAGAAASGGSTSDGSTSDGGESGSTSSATLGSGGTSDTPPPEVVDVTLS